MSSGDDFEVVSDAHQGSTFSRKEKRDMIHHRTIAGPLMSNGFALERTPERLGWLVPTDAALPLAHIKDLYHQQGYVWLKGFFERREILAFRRDFFAAFEGTGLLARGSDPVEGFYGGGGGSSEP